MNHTFNIKTYEELKAFFRSITHKYCETCKEITYHLSCGFGNSMRLECLKCQ